MIYLDHHATTPCDARVVEAMLPYFSTHFGNAASAHEAGTRAFDAVKTAREQVAALIGAAPREIIWTSGATEANNLALLGLARGARVLAPSRRRILTTPIEHKSVLEPLRALQNEGFEIIALPVDGEGQVALQAARETLDERVLLLCVQAANGEIGTLQPVSELAEIAHGCGALVHCDAAQAAGKIALDANALEADFLSLSAHKLYGSKGVGALWIRRGLSTRIAPLQHGGGQERGLRPGTLPVPLLVGFGVACEIARVEMHGESARLKTLRDAFESQLQLLFPDVFFNGARQNRLPHNSSFTFSGVPADALLSRLPHLALSSGAACDSGAPEPSKVLQAIGLTRADAASTLRAGLG